MDAYSLGKMTGVTAGLLIGFLVVAVIAVICNKNRKLKTQYDERQQIARGKGFRFGFYSMIAWAVINEILAFGAIELPIEPAMMAFSYIFIGVATDVTYCIFHDAYWGLNNNKMRYLICFLFVAALNVFVVIRTLRSGELFVDGRLGTYGINAFCALLFVLIGIAIAIQMIREKSAGKETE
ncbi:MAG: hypothetical protein J6Y57_08985 [Lachnospiraceae bacterium]|nr:hypothetical protein [Lachnospiraceae bacterium]